MATLGPLAKGWRRPVGAMLVLAVFALPGAILSQSPQPREAKVQLSWQTGWTPAGIAVEAGDTLSIRVRTIKGAAEHPQPVCERNPATGDRAHCRQSDRKGGTLPDAILNFAARQVILGRLGEGKPFVVGHNFKKVMKAGGPLSLRWEVPREAARAAQGFNVVIRVEPAPATEEGSDQPNPVNENDPPRNTMGPADPVVNDQGPVANEAVPEPAGDQGNVAQPEQNVVSPIDPVASTPPAETTAEARDVEVVTADAPEPGRSTAQTAVIAAAVAAVLLALVAAGVGVQRWRRRRLVNRTRTLLSVSPSLDLSEGACRGGGRPAEGPAASLRARLEDGPVHKAGGPKDG